MMSLIMAAMGGAPPAHARVVGWHMCAPTKRRMRRLARLISQSCAGPAGSQPSATLAGLQRALAPLRVPRREILGRDLVEELLEALDDVL